LVEWPHEKGAGRWFDSISSHMILKKLAYYYDGGTWLIRTTKGDFFVDNRFGDLQNDVWVDQIRVAGEFYNPTKKVLFAKAHPHEKESRIANQYEVNSVLNCMLAAVGFSYMSTTGEISKKKYELIDTLCNFAFKKRSYHLHDYY
jgi:hypothetical protein